MCITMMLATRIPVKAMAQKENSNDFVKRAQKDIKKLSGAFDRLQKQKRPDLGKHLQSIVDDIDKTAKGDVKKIQEIFESTDEDTIDLDDDFTEVDDVVIFKK